MKLLILSILCVFSCAFNFEDTDYNNVFLADQSKQPNQLDRQQNCPQPYQQPDQQQNHQPLQQRRQRCQLCQRHQLDQRDQRLHRLIVRRRRGQRINPMERWRSLSHDQCIV